MSSASVSQSDPAAQHALSRLFAGERLPAAEVELLFGELVAGRLDEPSIAGMLIALKVGGEDEAALTGAARALRTASAHFPRPDYRFADTCGTGGDGSGLINVSTAVGFVVAAAGLPVVKHGNRSITSRCGSADVLEQLGARLDVDAEESRRVLDETGICFLFAPLYHPGLRHAGPVRRALKTRTIMNLLGPCLNPAHPPVQLLGVAEERLLEPVALTLAALGVEDALIVHGAGLDEVALHAETEGVRLRSGTIARVTLSPEQAGLSRRPLDDLKGGGPEENAARLTALLRGQGGQAETDMVALNAGALLMTAGLASNLLEGTAKARDAIDSGAAGDRLARFVEASRG